MGNPRRESNPHSNNKICSQHCSRREEEEEEEENNEQELVEDDDMDEWKGIFASTPKRQLHGYAAVFLLLPF